MAEVQIADVNFFTKHATQVAWRRGVVVATNPDPVTPQHQLR